MKDLLVSQQVGGVVQESEQRRAKASAIAVLALALSLIPVAYVISGDCPTPGGSSQ